MQKVKIYSILKSSDKEFVNLENMYKKNISKFAKVEDYYIFNKQIESAQKIGAKEAKSSYSDALLKYFKGGYNILLDPKGKSLDSYEFAKLFDRANINFFIGGAYGFDSKIKEKSDIIISLSNLTFAHQLAKVVLLEQIFRGFAIRANHPYHK